RMIDARMGQEVFNEVALKGHDPRTFVLYACGGAGGAHAVGFAPFIGVGKIVVPLQSSVFGAFGASTMAIKEVWERSRSLKLFNWAEQAYLSELAPFNDLVSELVDLATRDLKLEGFDERDMAFRLELDMRYGSQYNMTRVAAPTLRLESADDVKALCDAFTARYAEVYSPEATFPAGGINVESFFLTASVAQDAFALPAETLAAPEPDANAQTETRPVYWDPADGFTDTPIYDARRLKPGNRISGPAVIESPDTTHVVAPGWTFHIDAWRNGVLERSA
ncbi:MAG: hypothetical protein H3C60_04580, partial [Sphingomonadaceae bacterium]|nr:hypothetical protein [Sphingomonadaceae bacterium]